MVRVVGKEGALGAGGGWELPQRHRRFIYLYIYSYIAQVTSLVLGK